MILLSIHNGNFAENEEGDIVLLDHVANRTLLQDLGIIRK